MMQGLLQRKSVPLGRPDWLSEPWKDVHKSAQQKVYDQGLILAGIFERVDKLTEPDVRDDRCSRIIEDCHMVYEEIKSIIEEHFHSSPARNEDPGPTDEYSPQPCQPEHRDCSSSLLTRIVALGIALGGCTSGCKAYFKLISQPKLVHPDEASNSTCSHGTLQTGIDLCLKQRKLAKSIVHSVAAYVEGRKGLKCNAKLFFSLRQAARQLEPDDVEYAECIAIMRKLQTHTWQFGVLVAPMSV
jgi:hypothetical protein